MSFNLLFVCILFHTVRTGLEGPGLTVAQKLWYGIAIVGGQYIWARLQSFSAFRRWGDSEQVMHVIIFSTPNLHNAENLIRFRKCTEIIAPMGIDSSAAYRCLLGNLDAAS